MWTLSSHTSSGYSLCMVRRSNSLVGLMPSLRDERSLHHIVHHLVPHPSNTYNKTDGKK